MGFLNIQFDAKYQKIEVGRLETFKEFFGKSLTKPKNTEKGPFSLVQINSGARPDVDLTSSERHRSPEKHYRKKTWENVLKPNISSSNQNRHDTENSFESHSSDEDYNNI